MKDYEIIAFDAQYFLFRNVAALKGRVKELTVTTLDESEGDSTVGYLINKYDIKVQDMVKQFFWTIAKFIRENYSCNKVIFLWDKGPYYKTKILPDFKNSRIHHCQELLDDWDIEGDPEGYLQEKEDYRIHLLMSEAKYWIIEHLNLLGFNSVIMDGFEADDLAVIFSRIYDKIGTHRSAICSADSDWQYWIGDKVDYLSFNKKTKWNRDTVNQDWEGMLDETGLTPFELKKWADSTFFSHNDLQHTSNIDWKQLPELIDKVQMGDYSLINDIDRFKLNMKSFDIEEYPSYADVSKHMVDAITCEVQYDSWDNFNKLVSEGFKITQAYMTNTWNILK